MNPTGYVLTGLTMVVLGLICFALGYAKGLIDGDPRNV